MANKEDMQDDGVVVVMTDQDGNEYYYEEEMIIPVGDEKYEWHGRGTLPDCQRFYGRGFQASSGFACAFLG